MCKLIPLSVPVINGNEWKYIKECLDTEWVSSAGKYVDKFEEEIIKFTGAKYAIAVVNGTAALHTALLVAGVKPDEEVIVPTLTFISPINTVKYVGAHPVFMDSDEYFNIDVNKTIEFIDNETELREDSDDKSRKSNTYNKKTGRKISAIIPVHIYGNACNLSKLVDICKKRNITIIEDATESLGTYYTKGKYKGEYTGTIGDIGCYSFNGNKIITTGGGGMIVTDNKDYAEKSRYLTTQAKDDPLRYIHNEIGYNHRLTNIQAALGVAQLERLPEYIDIKKRNYNEYKKVIDKIPGLYLSDVPDYAENNYWFYTLLIDEDIYKKTHEELMEYLLSKKIQTRPIWELNHRQKPYKDYQNYKIKKAIELIDKTLCIPCSVNLTYDDIQKVVGELRDG